MISRMSSLVFVVLAFPLLTVSAQAETPELNEAIGLLKKIHDDQCQRHLLRSKVMVAHRDHDQKTLNALYPQLDTVTKKLKPDEDRIKQLQSSIAEDASNQLVFESAMVELTACE